MRPVEHITAMLIASSLLISCAGRSEQVKSDQPTVALVCSRPLVDAWITGDFGSGVLEDLKAFDAVAKAVVEHAKPKIDGNGCISTFMEKRNETTHQVKITLYDFRLQKVGGVIAFFTGKSYRLIVNVNVELSDLATTRIIAVEGGASDQYIDTVLGLKTDLVSFSLDDKRFGDAIKEAVAQAVMKMSPRMVERLSNGGK